MKYGPEMTEEICSYLKSGNNRTDSCVLAGIAYETFMRWMDKEEFSENIKKAETAFKNECIQVIRKAGPTSWQAAAWMLERKYPKEFALKIKENEKDSDIPEKMAKRAHDLLQQLEGKKPNATISKNGNGLHPD